MSQSPVSRRVLLFLTLLITGAMALSWFAQIGQTATCAIPIFEVQPPISLTSSPQAVVVDDFNEDGKPDLAVANRLSGTITILLGNGSGGFSAPTNFPSGRDAVFVASGDLNGDGNVDLVTANHSSSGSGGISVLLGNGSGGFPTHTSPFLGGNGVSAVAIGDVNADGKADVVITSPNFNTAGILLGNGSGGLTSFQSFNVGGFSPAFVVMKDLNGDGKLDLVVANQASANVGVLLGSGTGAFSSPTTFAVGTSPLWIATGDFNSDSKLDLAVANTNSHNISILSGDGAGGFGAATNHNSNGTFPLSIAAADFNGDGKVDLAVSNSQPGTVVVFSGDGAGSFAPVSNFRGGGRSSAVGDFNADGQIDVAVVIDLPGTVSVMLNTCGDNSLPQIQLRVPNPGGNESSGGTPAVVTVIRTGDITGTASVDYATANGQAIAPDDYISASGTVTFLPGEISKTITITIVDDTLIEAPEVFSLTLSNVTGMATLGSPSVTSVVISSDDDQTKVQFSSAGFSADEGVPSLQVTVTRTGETQATSSVNYGTGEGFTENCSTPSQSASSRCDYSTTVGTLNFAAGEISKTISVPFVDDAYDEPNETFSISLSNPIGAVLGLPGTATLTINDNDTPGGSNPIDQPAFFVRLQYLDFLNREPDAAGLAFWSNQITECLQPGATCNAEVRRINVSAAFFLSIEFQETGYLVYKFYKAAYGNIPGAPVPVFFGEFRPDTQQIGQGVVVGETGWPQKLESNKVAYAQAFVSRSRFSTAHPTTRTPVELVDAIFANAGVTPSAADRNAAIDEFAGAPNTADTGARARALRRVAENPALTQQEFSKAFVLMQYFGYLRRYPSASPEPGGNFDGYNFWLGKLNEFNGNYIAAELVKAFISSSEYRQRFGQ